MKCALRDAGMDTRLNIADAVATIEGIDPTYEPFVYHDTAHAVGNALDLEGHHLIVRPESYYVTEGLAYETEQALYANPGTLHGKFLKRVKEYETPATTRIFISSARI